MKKGNRYVIMVAFVVVLMNVNFAYAKAFYFADVPETHWAYENIKKCYDEDIVKGITATRFDPSGILTNGQFITMLTRAMYSDIVEVDSGIKWYSASLNYFDSNKLLVNTDINEDSIDDSINRATVSQVIYNIISKNATTVSESANKYTDLNENLDMFSAVIDSGVLTGYKDATFQPDGTLTRAEACTVVQRLLLYINGEKIETPYIQDPEEKIDFKEQYSFKNTSLENQMISVETRYSNIPGDRIRDEFTSGETDGQIYAFCSLPSFGNYIFDKADNFSAIDISCYFLDGTLVAKEHLYGYENNNNGSYSGDNNFVLYGENFIDAITKEENIFYIKVEDTKGRIYIGQPLVNATPYLLTDPAGKKYIDVNIGIVLTYDDNGQLVFDKNHFEEKEKFYNSLYVEYNRNFYFPKYN